ncbi:RICIN domain-containing protein [Pseudobacteroides cellulosolvens]|uniref:Ricin B lectin n=1 Tax=Pseudobacteroides cellulosolvens ATCC 35603 = DSM 2933 TaxID=398512 RepID=A0A0L6JPX5_9FIRM|nr:RICIN domain-containing protein [Pseudobacteroides cellulosolvens]KNY27839.1 Ricin B lectin [Pseudobacteroides cellulosolvens ATCC 35603 = DSM 2933]
MDRNVLKKLIPMVLCIAITVTLGSFIFQEGWNGYSIDNIYFSPFDTAYSSDGSMIAVSDSTKSQLQIIKASDGSIQKVVPLNGQPKALTWNGNKYVYVCEYGAGTVAEVEPFTGSVTRRFSTGSKPLGAALIAGKLVVSDYGLRKVSVVDLSSGSVEKDISVKDYPYFMDGTVDGKYAIVGHALPSGNASAPKYAASVTFVDIDTKLEEANIMLPQGSSNVRGIKCSPDGKWAYVLHTFGKTSLPTTQITKGWVMTNAVTIIDVAKKNIYTTFILDRITEGAADPWGLTISPDSKTMWVSLSGTHQVLKIDLNRLHQLLAGNINGGSNEPVTQFDSNSYYKLINRNSGKALDVPGGNSANNTQLVQWDDNGNNNQQYRIITNSDGYYSIINRGTNKALDNAGASVDNSPVVEWDQSNSDNQKWKLIDTGEGYYKLQIKSSQKYMDVSGASRNNNAGIVTNSSSTGLSQQWKILKGGATGSPNSNYSLLYRSKSGYDKPYSDIWFQIKADPAKRDNLKYDLGALWGASILKKIDLSGQGPRGISISPDGKNIAVAAYFSGEVYFINAAEDKLQSTIKLGTQPAENPVRRGERTFHDASTTTQKWLSCASCHPEGRADGLDWDMPNDGIGNTKNTKSMLNIFDTPPAMWRGVRTDADVGIKAGFRFIKFKEPTQQELDDVAAYIKSLSSEPNPYANKDGTMTTDAALGKAIFESSETQCSSCHSGPFYTDLEAYDVGTKDILDPDGMYYTPTLLEMWRTAPYLHDGSAATIREVLTTKNEGDRHGKTSHLTSKQLDQLEAYILQIGSNASTITTTATTTATITTNTVLKEDLNKDGVINMTDVILLATSFNMVREDPKYVEARDLNGDGAINIADVIILAAKFNTVI